MITSCCLLCFTLYYDRQQDVAWVSTFPPGQNALQCDPWCIEFVRLKECAASICALDAPWILKSTLSAFTPVLYTSEYIPGEHFTPFPPKKPLKVHFDSRHGTQVPACCNRKRQWNTTKLSSWILKLMLHNYNIDLKDRVLKYRFVGHVGVKRKVIMSSYAML